MNSICYKFFVFVCAVSVFFLFTRLCCFALFNTTLRSYDGRHLKAKQSASKAPDFLESQ